MNLLQYIKMHKPTNGSVDCCWDCPDKVFDAVVTVDCSVDPEGHVDIVDDKDDEFPNMPLFINEFLGKVQVVSLMGDGTPIIDVDGLLRRNIATVREWCSKNWSVDLETWDDDDIIYQLIQEVHYGIAGYKGNNGYKAYYDLIRMCDVEV